MAGVEVWQVHIFTVGVAHSSLRFLICFHGVGAVVLKPSAIGVTRTVGTIMFIVIVLLLHYIFIYVVLNPR